MRYIRLPTRKRSRAISSMAGRRVRRRIGSGLTRAMVRRRFLTRAGRWIAAAQLGGAAISAIRARRRTGNRIGSSDAKRKVQDVSNTVGRNSFQQYVIDLTALGAAADGRDTREKSATNISGWKIWFDVRAVTETPTYFNMAVISPKTSTTVGLPDFFRTAGAQRAVAFDSTANNAQFMYHAPINTDVYNIMWHYRTRLAGNKDSSPGSVVDYSSGGTSYKTIEKWIPFKRQLRFDLTTSTVPQDGRVYLVFWGNKMFDNSPLAQLQTFDTVHRIVTYFRDAQN